MYRFRENVRDTLILGGFVLVLLTIFAGAGPALGGTPNAAAYAAESVAAGGRACGPAAASLSRDTASAIGRDNRARAGLIA